MPKITVRVNDIIKKYGGELHDPFNGTAYGAEPVEAEETPFIRARVPAGDLIAVEVPAAKSKKDKEEKEK